MLVHIATGGRGAKTGRHKTMMKRRDCNRLLGGLAIVPALTPERVLGSAADDPPVHPLPQKWPDDPFPRDRRWSFSGMNAAQLAAFDAFVSVGFAGFHNLSRVIERAPLTVESTTDTYRFSVPASSVEMRLLPGLGGEPIRIEGLPSPAFFNYVQYESVTHTHNSGEARWTYSGTNGFRSEMRASG